MRAEFLGERGFPRPAADGGDPVSKFIGNLNSKMPEAADALDGDEIGRECAAVAQGVESGNTRAKERAGFHGVEAIRHCGERFHRSDHVFLIAAIEADSANFRVAAIGEISAAAREASAVLAAVPADADALAFFPAGDAGADVIDHAGDFVSGGAGILSAGPVSFFYEAVAVTDAASLHANAHVPRARIWNVALLNFEICARLGYDGDLHLWHKGFLVDVSYSVGLHVLDALLGPLVMKDRATVSAPGPKPG